jgi:hypothetical protein
MLVPRIAQTGFVIGEIEVLSLDSIASPSQ